MITFIDTLAGTMIGLMCVLIGYMLGGITPRKELIDEKRR